jgi:hypothetical protein
LRLKDHKRFVIGAQKLIKRAAAERIVDLTSGIVSHDFSVTEPEVLRARDVHYLRLLSKVGIFAVKAGNADFALEVATFVRSFRQGGVKRNRN